MRDIRSDLQERVSLIEKQITAAHARFQQIVERLQVERDTMIAALNTELAALGKVMEAESRRTNNLQPALTSAAPMKPLADLFMRKLDETGPMSKDELLQTAVQEGYFPSLESAGPIVNATLANMVRTNRIGQSPDGCFEPPALPRTIMLRRAV
jgi:hypothetical protein